MSRDADHARRAFIRDNHPDRGGDPELFVAGLRELELRGQPPTVTGRPHRTVRRRLQLAVSRLLHPNPPRVR